MSSNKKARRPADLQIGDEIYVKRPGNHWMRATVTENTGKHICATIDGHGTEVKLSHSDFGNLFMANYEEFLGRTIRYCKSEVTVFKRKLASSEKRLQRYTDLLTNLKGSQIKNEHCK